MKASRNNEFQKSKHTTKPQFELLQHPSVVVGISLYVSYTDKLSQGFSFIIQDRIL